MLNIVAQPCERLKTSPINTIYTKPLESQDDGLHINRLTTCTNPNRIAIGIKSRCHVLLEE